MNVHLNLRLVQNELPGFTEDLRATRIDHERISRMKAGWVNDYSAHLEYCTGALEEMLIVRPSRVLECGSGFTTILLAIAAREIGASLTVLEHDALWADIARRALRFLHLPEEPVVHAPIVSYGDFEWYKMDGVSCPSPFDFVLCDGPPGSTTGGRVGLLPVLKEKLSAKCIVLLDDAGRPGEAQVLEHWKKQFGACVQMKGRTHSYAAVSFLAQTGS